MNIALLLEMAAEAAPDRVGLVCDDRKSTCLNSSHQSISYAVLCLKKNNKCTTYTPRMCNETAHNTKCSLSAIVASSTAPSLLDYLFFFNGSRHHPRLPSFPTRRSSDLAAA